MPRRALSIAMLAANPAFAAILARVLETDGGHAVATFERVEALVAHLRTTPVDLVVLDAELPGAPAMDLARGLRAHLKLASDDFTIVALTRLAGSALPPLLAAGIDEVLTKPVSPARLLALAATVAGDEPELRVANGGMAGMMAGAANRRGGNVIPLFGEGRSRR